MKIINFKDMYLAELQELISMEATTYGLAPFFLHFPKKPFVAKAARCDLSTVQVLERACVRRFWGRPELF